MLQIKSIRGLALLACIALAVGFSRHSQAAAVKHINIADLDVAVWLPSDKPAVTPWPIVIFSHGFHGSNTQSVFLMEALAKAGYAVFAPNHADAVVWNPLGWLNPPDQPFSDISKWTDATYANRGRDIRRLVDALSKDTRYNTLSFDWTRIAIAGHSLGGYTALGLAGAWPAWADPRVKAVLALSPYGTPFIAQKTLANIHVPVMYQGGTLDTAITPYVKAPNGAYDQTPPPKYFVEFDGAGHLAWIDLQTTYQSIISQYSVAFLDHAIKGKPFPKSLTGTGGQVSTFRQQEK